MKVRLSSCFLWTYRAVTESKRAQINEFCELLLELFKCDIFDNYLEIRFEFFRVPFNNVYVHVGFKTPGHSFEQFISLKDVTLIIDTIIEHTKDEEIERKYRKKKLELEMGV